MAKLNFRPGNKRAPELGPIYYRTLHGQLIAQSKPRPRGRGGSAKQIENQKRFADAARAVKYMDPAQIHFAKGLTASVAIMWRDYLMQNLTGRFGALLLEDGRIIHSVSEQQDTSDALDSIGQATGQILYRSAGRWTALPAGISGEVLVSGGPAADPNWQPGTSLWALVETKVVAGLTAVAFQNLAPNFHHRWTMSELRVTADNATILARVSSNNGVTFETADYKSMLRWQDQAAALGSQTANNRILIIDGIGNLASERGNGELISHSNLGDTESFKMFQSHCTRWNGTPVFVRDAASGSYFGDTFAIDAIAIAVNTGTFFGIISLERRPIVPT